MHIIECFGVVASQVESSSAVHTSMISPSLRNRRADASCGRPSLQLICISDWQGSSTPKRGIASYSHLGKTCRLSWQVNSYDWPGTCVCHALSLSRTVERPKLYGCMHAAIPYLLWLRRSLRCSRKKQLLRQYLMQRRSASSWLVVPSRFEKFIHFV